MFGNYSGRPPFRTLMAAYQLLNAPSAEPISTAEAKLQCRRPMDETNEDSLHQVYSSAARNQVEADTCRAVCWQRWQLSLDRWPDVIELYKCPVIAVESVEYLDLSAEPGVWQTVDQRGYTVSLTEPCRINTSYAHYWLPARFQMGAIRVTFTAGYLVPFTVTAGSNLLTFIDYTPTDGDSFRLSNSGGQLPSPLQPNVTYYIVNASGHTCNLSATSGGSTISLTQPGSGLQFLGTLPGGLKIAMLKHIATNYADREGSDAAANCERSYMQSLRSVQYVVM